MPKIDFGPKLMEVEINVWLKKLSNNEFVFIYILKNYYTKSNLVMDPEYVMI